MRRGGEQPTWETSGKQGEMRTWQSSEEEPSRRDSQGDQEEVESSPLGRQEASKERWRDQNAAEKQSGRGLQGEMGR